VKHRHHRISVIGTSGSGKTTVAAEIAERLSIRHVELDALHWKPGWREAALDEFIKQTDEATSGESWVVDGNYSKVRDIVWGRAETVVWLDLPFRVVFWRVLWRTISRIMTGEELWSGNRERFGALFGPDSMPLWVLKTYWRRKKQYSELLRRAEYSHLVVIRLRSSREISEWLDSLSADH
jgi:adenylate kinase family enzyme